MSGRRVDVHVHHLPGVLVEAYRRREEVPRLVDELVDMGGGLAYPLLPVLVDTEPRLAAMDEHGVDASLLSVPPPGLEAFSPEDAVGLARACNDQLAELGPRLPAIALLPLQAPEAAAEELARAAGRGLRGGLLYSHAGRVHLDDERFEPIFEAAAELRLPLVLHPTTPVDDVSGYALTTTLGFLVETTVCALRLALGGLFDRHPELDVVVPHVGSVIPYILGRIDYEAAIIPGGAGVLRVPPSEHLRRFHTDSVCAWPSALRLALDVFGPERVMFGSDEPYWRIEDGLATIEALGLDEPGVWHENADRLFALSNVG